MTAREHFNLPTLLTLIRLILSPLLLPLLLVYLLPFNALSINLFLAIVFLFFALTDFFDGYFARRYGQETSLGEILDPIADKFLIYSTLIALQAAGKLYFYWAVLLIGREFFIMGIRYVALQEKLSVKVSFLAKVKTAFQMMTIIVIILNPYQHKGLWGAFAWNGVELVLLVGSLYLSLYTAKQYYSGFMSAYQAQNPLFSKKSAPVEFPIDE